MISVLRRYFDFIYSDMVRQRLELQLSALGAKRGGTYLDVGCHVGYNTDRVRQRLFPERTIGLEYDFESLRQAKSRGCEVVCLNLNDPIPLRSNLADVITIFDVLEHLVETWRFLLEVYRLLQPGGVVLIDSPNLAAWHNIFLLCAGYQPSSGPHLISIADSDLKMVESMHRRDHCLLDGEADSVAGSMMHRHIVVPAFRSLKRVLIQAGFAIEGCWGVGYHPFPPPLSRWLCKLDISHAHHFLIRARKPGDQQTNP